jgi:hypothetical protein
MFGHGRVAKQKELGPAVFGYALFNAGNGCYQRALLFREEMTEYNGRSKTCKIPSWKLDIGEIFLFVIPCFLAAFHLLFTTFRPRRLEGC